MIVAIDGPAGSGKSTTARLAAARTGFLHLDTGAMYRAVTLAWQRAGLGWSAEHADTVLEGLDLAIGLGPKGMTVHLGDHEASDAIRAQQVTDHVSFVAALPVVRHAMVAEQQRLANVHVASGGGVILDGRDIGTVVFPDAALKIFLVADVLERARRRLVEKRAKGEPDDLDAVRRDLERRDTLDSQRAVAPLRPAQDAIQLDTTGLSIEQQVDAVVGLIRERQSV